MTIVVRQCWCHRFLGTQQHAEELIKQADIAMYQSKRGGRNQLSLFDPRMQQSLIKRASIEAELQRALRKKRTPFVLSSAKSMSGDKPLAPKALLRWNHPTLGSVPPVEFIPIAETGLILPVGHWVWKNRLSANSSMAIASQNRSFSVSGQCQR